MAGGVNDQITKIIDKNSADELSIITAGSKGAAAVISVDSSGNVVTRAAKLSQVTTIAVNTETTVITADTTHYLDVYGVIITNTSSTTVSVTFKDATSGTTRFVIEAPATDTRGFMLDVNSAVAQTALNSNWTATCSSGVSSVIISMLYIKNT